MDSNSSMSTGSVRTKIENGSGLDAVEKEEWLKEVESIKEYYEK